LSAGARVTVVAPEGAPELRSLLTENQGRLFWRRRSFVEDDLDGAFLVVAATNDAAVNRRASIGARERHVLANVADDPEASDFLVPSVLERGALQLAVSTSGQAPALAAVIRRRLEELFSEDWAGVVELYGEARGLLLDSRIDPDLRGRLNSELAQLDLEGLLASGGLAQVRAAAAALLEEAGAGAAGGQMRGDPPGEQS
jgi:precorrin-2 dehydrogenase/sirohydrochlorin ferrochelatase